MSKGYTQKRATRKELYKMNQHSLYKTNILPYDKLNQIATQNADHYQSAKPFAHGVYDNVFEDSLLSQIIEEFAIDQSVWRKFGSKYEAKSQMSSDQHLLPFSRALIHNLNSAPFLLFLEHLTGIENLIPDPYLHGAGLHKSKKGGKLGVHIDFNRHRKMNVQRRINVLIYLNKDWDSSWGGDFELWDEAKLACEKKIAPLFNRMAIFSTTETSFHGHPHPLTCPDNRERLSIALYYYTASEQDSELSNHSTIFLDSSGNREELSVQISIFEKIKLKLKNALNISVLR